MARGSSAGHREHKFRIILGILFFGIFFSFGVSEVEAAPIKILSNSRHAYSTIISTIDQLLGRAHNPVTEFVIHSTSMDSTFAGYTTPAFATSTSYYNESGTLVPSQAPYQIYTTSFTGYPGDTVATYNQYSTPYDFTDNYAFTASAPLAVPPTFHTAPGNGGWASAAGVEWTIDPAVFCVASLSCLTAANAGIMAWLRFEHPTWNWFDVKAAMRQNGTNWATGYSKTTYGFGIVNATTTNALVDNQILLQPPVVATSTSGTYNQLTFTLYPFRQTRRVKDVLFQFASNAGFQGNELTLANIQALGGTKITEYSGTTATTSTPFFTAITNGYFVWFTADNNIDSSANFSRIDTYTILGPLSQNEISFSGTFDLASPSDNVSTTSSPTFTWNAASSYLGISKYQLFIDGALNKDNIAATSATATASLSDGAHTWYVKAFNGGGTATSSVSTRTVNIVSDYMSGYTFYVDNVLGNDNNPGTQALPWATLTKAASTAQAGDTVVIIKNVDQPYRVTFSPTNHGTSGSPITYRGVDAQHKPEIWGSNDVSDSWSSYGGGNANTYQRTLTTQTWVVATGLSIGSLTKRVNGSSKTSLNAGEWIWDSNILYYRLASGEDISTLHVEASARSYGISGTSYITFKNIVVRYEDTAGVDLNSTGSIVQGIEAYDSYSGIVLEYGAHSTLNYCVSAGNDQYGIAGGYGNLTVYNSLMYGNGVSGYNIDVWFTGSAATLKNNISSGNTSTSFSFSTFWGPPTFTASNNAWDIAGDSRWDVFKGTNNQELKDSLFVSTTTRDFHLQQFSPNIDAGTSISGLTTDILGNPIYGTPDIGPYEYQPPYSITSGPVPMGAGFRVYKDGRYRMTTATSSGTTAAMSIVPEGGFPTGNYSEWLNVTVNTWNTSGDYAKSWTESSPVTTTTTVHTVGDLAPNGFYAVSVDGTRYAQFRADAGGQGTFTYSGGYSTHTFSVSPDLSIGNGPIFGSSFGLPTVLPNESTPIAQPNISSSGGSQTMPTTSGTSLFTASTTSIATTTLPILSISTTTATTTPTVIKEKIIELKGKLIVLLKRLVVLLTEQLQNITKTIYQG